MCFRISLISAGVVWIFLMAVLGAPVEAVDVEHSVEQQANALPGGVDAGWWGRMQRGIAASEYWFKRGPASYRAELGTVYQAPNRAQNLRLYAASGGMMVLDRTAEGAPELLRLELKRHGRRSALDEAQEPVIGSEGSRLNLSRPGLTEWYDNRPEGVEHGFDLLERPVGDGPVVL